MITLRSKSDGENMSDEYILDDVIETFSDEDTLLSDIQNNPVKWLLSLAIIVPGMAYTMANESSYASAMTTWGLPENLEWILAIFVTGQLFIAPLSCYFLARTGNVAPGLFIAMGGSAILVANPLEIAEFSEAIGWPFAIFCVALSILNFSLSIVIIWPSVWVVDITASANQSPE